MDHFYLILFAAKVKAYIDSHKITNADSDFDYIGSLIKDLEALVSEKPQ